MSLPTWNAERSRGAGHCSQRAALAATATAPRVGERFDGMITGASDKGVWARLVSPPIEGRLHGSVQGLAVGDHVSVRLVSTDPWKGFIDFEFIARK